MRADTDANVEVSLQRHAQPTGGDLGLAAGSSQGHVNVIAPLCDAQASGAGQVRLNLSCDHSLFVTILQRGHPHPVQRHVGIHRIRVEALPQHQYGFLVRISSGGRKRNVGGQGDIARNFLPDKLKGIGGKPHVLAATGEGIGFRGRIVFNGARMQDRAYIAMLLEYSKGCGCWLCPGVVRCDGGQQKDNGGQNGQRCDLLSAQQKTSSLL